MERAPTYEEVQAFAESEGLDSKTNVPKFYEYYSQSDFTFKGRPMDWKARLRQWATTEKTKRGEIQPAAIKREYPRVTREYLDWLEKKIEEWGK